MDTTLPSIHVYGWNGKPDFEPCLLAIVSSYNDAHNFIEFRKQTVGLGYVFILVWRKS